MDRYTMKVNGIDHIVQVDDVEEATRRGLIPVGADPVADEVKVIRKSRRPANKAAAPDDDKSEE